MQFLNRREADIDGVLVDTLKIGYLGYLSALSIKIEIFVEEVFGGTRVEEVVLRLFNDISRVNEEEEVAVAVLIEIEHQPCHNERFAAAGSHVKEEVERFLFAFKFLVKAEVEPRECVLLVRPEFKCWVQILRDAIRHLLR